MAVPFWSTQDFEIQTQQWLDYAGISKMSWGWQLFFKSLQIISIELKPTKTNTQQNSSVPKVEQTKTNLYHTGKRWARSEELQGLPKLSSFFHLWLIFQQGLETLIFNLDPMCSMMYQYKTHSFYGSGDCMQIAEGPAPILIPLLSVCWRHSPDLDWPISYAKMTTLKSS